MPAPCDEKHSNVDFVKIENDNDNEKDDSRFEDDEDLDSGNVTHRIRRLSERIQRRSSSASLLVQSSMPETPQGWTVLVSVLLSAIAGYELNLQQQLTSPPLVFGQVGTGPLNDVSCSAEEKRLPLQDLWRELTATPDSILARDIQPSLLVGSRSALASGAALVLGHPYHSVDHVRFRQVLTMAADGAQLALQWELPPLPTINNDDRQERILHDQSYKLDQPVVLVLHGINNSTDSAYLRAMMRTCSDRGWIAVGMNFRGCGGVPFTTPRGYNGAYTGDLRGVVQYLTGRMSPDVPLFLVGHSLGANLVVKYLGEEGLSGSLPACVAGGVSLGNPFHIHSKDHVPTPWKQLLAWGVKLDFLAHGSTFWQLWQSYPEYRSILRRVFLASNIGQVDSALAPVTLRNDTMYPFGVSIGYDNGEEYWHDASSYRYIHHVSVPLLQIIAGDDGIVYDSFQKKLAHSLLNPNVMCVETKCGGHLGWQESPPPDGKHNRASSSWAGRATSDFFDAILKTRINSGHPQSTSQSIPERSTRRMATTEKSGLTQNVNNDGKTPPILLSRL